MPLLIVMMLYRFRHLYAQMCSRHRLLKVIRYGRSRAGRKAKCGLYCCLASSAFCADSASAQLHVPASAILPTASRSIMLPGTCHYFSTARHFKFWHNLAPVVLPGLCWPCETVPWEAAGALCVMGLVEFVIRQPLLSELIPQSVIQQVHTNELLLMTLVELVEILSRRGIDCWYRMQIFSLGVTV